MNANSRVFTRFAPTFDLGGRGTTIFLLFMASVLLLASFFRPQTTEGLRTGAGDLFLPVFAAISQPFQTAADVISDVSGVAQMRAEIAQLQSENERLRDKITELVNAGNHELLVDLEAVEFLDSTGLGVLVGGLKKVRAQEGTMALICSQDRLLKIFRITGLAKVFTIHESEAAALSA